MTSEATVHDIGEARDRRNQKRYSSGGAPSHDAKLIAFVRERLSASKQWKVVKKSPSECSDLIRIARNLHGLLDRVPYGAKKDALAKAGFGGGDDKVATSYSQNVAIDCEPGQVTKNRLRRLTPNIGAYVKVAEQCPPYGDAAVAQLFRGTLWEARLASDSIRTSWMRELSENLRRAADKIAEKTDLPRLFDRMSEANLCIRENTRYELAATNWLSVTFHKTDGRPLDGAENEPYWRIDREDEGAPLGGVVLFSPKVELSRNEKQFELEKIQRTEPDPAILGAARVVITTSLYLAILPAAQSLSDPATIDPVFVVRPTMRLQTSGGPIPITFAGPKEGLLHFAWQDPDSRDLFMYEAETDLGAWSEFIRQFKCLPPTDDDSVDFAVELSYILPFTSTECEDLLTGNAEGLLFVAPPPEDVIRDRLLMPHNEIEDIDLSAIVPERFAPQGTIASHLQRALVVPSSIIAELEADALAYRDAFNRLVEAANSLISHEDEAEFWKTSKDKIDRP